MSAAVLTLSNSLLMGAENLPAVAAPTASATVSSAPSKAELLTPSTNAVETPEKPAEDSNVIKLIPADNLEKFYTWIAGAGVFVDHHNVFAISKDGLRISGERNGYLATRQEYSDYRLLAEYKWGEAKFGERSKKPRNSGILIHGNGEDREWMRGLECQIAENRTGNVVLHGGARLMHGTNSFSKAWTELGKTDRQEENKAGEWNTLEIISLGGRVQVIVNDKVTMDVTDVQPNRGKILLQSNGAEIVFRRLELNLLSEDAKPFKEPEEKVSSARTAKAKSGK